jgi:flagellar basal-body rod protein FlgC
MTGSTEGVSVIEIELDQSDFQMRYEPGSPWADEAGYVGYPNVSVVVEQMNALEAARSYEANISAIEASKAMINAALQIIG